MDHAVDDEPRADRTTPPKDRSRSRFVVDEILRDSFEGALDRRAVLVLGAGLLRELADIERRSAWIDPDPRWGSFLSWPALRRRVSAIDGGDEPGAKAARLLDPPAAHEMTLMQLGYRLREARFRDIVTLDVDSTIEAALRSVGFALQTYPTARPHPNPHGAPRVRSRTLGSVRRQRRARIHACGVRFGTSR